MKIKVIKKVKMFTYSFFFNIYIHLWLSQRARYSKHFDPKNRKICWKLGSQIHFCIMKDSGMGHNGHYWKKKSENFLNDLQLNYFLGISNLTLIQDPSNYYCAEFHSPTLPTSSFRLKIASWAHCVLMRMVKNAFFCYYSVILSHTHIISKK